MKILVTGAAGFIGYHCSVRLLQLGHQVFGIDNLNEYYDVELKNKRLLNLSHFEKFDFSKSELSNLGQMSEAFKSFKPELVLHLGAQAGVRYSLENPQAYIDSNISGTLNILELCKESKPFLIYASSSSVYGRNKKIPFAVGDAVDSPASLYAATKRSNELMVDAYCSLYGIAAVGLRFFTVYGPWGRPDMAYFKFAESMIRESPINIFNNGNMSRDFTYVDDVVDGIQAIIDRSHSYSAGSNNLYNLGNNKPESLMTLIELIEEGLGVVAKKNYMPMQPGDVHSTFADIGPASTDLNYLPRVDLRTGISEFITWFKHHYVN